MAGSDCGAGDAERREDAGGHDSDWPLAATFLGVVMFSTPSPRGRSTSSSGRWSKAQYRAGPQVKRALRPSRKFHDVSAST